MSASAPACTVVFVDAYDERNKDFKKIVVSSAGVDFLFDFRRSSREERPTNAAIFVDEMALKDVVFRYPRHRRIALLQESPLNSVFSQTDLILERFDSVFTHNRVVIEKSPKVQKLLYGTSWVHLGKSPPDFSYKKEKLVSFVGSIQHPSNGAYDLRKRVVELLVQRGGVDLFGRGIRGFESKLPTLLPYRFSIAMENVRQDFYFSEKLIDCFMTRTVPIYWGPECVKDIFDPNGIIFFESLAQLPGILAGLSTESYDGMLESVKRNQATAIELQLNSPVAMYERLARQLDARRLITRSLTTIERSKLAAGLRKVIS